METLKETTMATGVPEFNQPYWDIIEQLPEITSEEGGWKPLDCLVKQHIRRGTKTWERVWQIYLNGNRAARKLYSGA